MCQTAEVVDCQVQGQVLCVFTVLLAPSRVAAACSIANCRCWAAVRTAAWLTGCGPAIFSWTPSAASPAVSSSAHDCHARGLVPGAAASWLSLPASEGCLADKGMVPQLCSPQQPAMPEWAVACFCQHPVGHCIGGALAYTKQLPEEAQLQHFGGAASAAVASCGPQSSAPKDSTERTALQV